MYYNNIDMTKNEYPAYRNHYWNYIRGNKDAKINLGNSFASDAGYFTLPAESDEMYDQAISEISIFRGLATVVTSFTNGKLAAYDYDDIVEFVPEMGTIEVKDISEGINAEPFKRCKLALIMKLPKKLIADAAFDLEGYVVKRLAKTFANSEDKAFINGSGVDEPEGVLRGAETSHTASELAFDDIIRLYFSVKPEYRENGVWLMNDETALTLRTLKDQDGNYLWKQANDTILGKPVVFSRFMPSAEDGAKPVAFGDFSYYWVIRRSPVMVRALYEIYELKGMNAYFAHEYLDGKLIRPEAVKTLLIGSGE